MTVYPISESELQQLHQANIETTSASTVASGFLSAALSFLLSGVAFYASPPPEPPIPNLPLLFCVACFAMTIASGLFGLAMAITARRRRRQEGDLLDLVRRETTESVLETVSGSRLIPVEPASD